MLRKPAAIFYVNESDSFWVKEVKSIPEYDDFDVEFGKRFLLKLLALPDGEKTFISFMAKAKKTFAHFKELEAIDFTNEEEKLFDKLKISRTIDKYLRTSGWKLYGDVMILGAGIHFLGILISNFYHQPPEVNANYWQTFVSEPYHNYLYPSCELLLGALLNKTASHGIDDLKYQELRRAVLSLTEKFPNAFIEESVKNVWSVKAYRQGDKWIPR